MQKPHALFRSQEGSMFPAMAAIMIAMIGMIGTAIDMGRYHMVQSRLSSALDAAGLAVGASGSSETASTIANQYMSANFPSGYMGSTLGTTTVTPNGANTVITLSATATVPTTFLYVLGIDSLTASASSQITKQNSGMELVLVLDNTGSMNCSVTNPNASCNGGTGTKIDGLRTAAAELLTVLYGSGNNTVPNLWVGVVPFSQTVNIGTSNTTWMNTTYNATLDFGPTISGTTCEAYTGTTPSTAGSYSSTPTCTYTLSGDGTAPSFAGQTPNNWGGCVMARPSPYDVTDDVPVTGNTNTLFQAYDYPYTADDGTTYDPWKTVTPNPTQNCTGSGRSRHCTTVYNTTTTVYSYQYQSSDPGYYGPNLFCPQPVLPMVAEQNTVVNEINSLTAGGSTLIDIGMAWGYRMLSPNWQGMWGGEMNANGLPLAYNTPLMSKVLILMTDGMNEFDPGNFTAYQYLDSNVLGTTNFTTANSTLDTRTLDVCTSLKNNGVIIYTIGFGTTDTPNTNNPTSVNGPMLQACATDANHYFLAPSNAQLEATFQTIANQLANLRVSQ